MEIPISKYSPKIQYKHFLIDDLGNVIDLRAKKYVFEQIANDLFDERRGGSLYFRHVPLQSKSAFYKSNRKRQLTFRGSSRHKAIVSSTYILNLKTLQIEQDSSLIEDYNQFKELDSKDFSFEKDYVLQMELMR